MKKLDFLPNLRNRYSIRRFTVGTASILIGSLLFLGHNGEAKAAENTNDNTVVEASKDTSTTQQAPVENTVPQDKTTDTIQQTGNSQTTQNVLETVKTDALSKLSTFTHLTEETVKHYTAEIKQAQSEADVQAVVEKAQKAEVEAEKQAEVAKQTEQTKATDTSTASSATTPEVSKSITDVVKEESKVEPSSTLSDTSKDADTKTVSSTAQAISTIETPTLSIEQKVDKVKAELVTDYDSSKVDAALAVIDTADLTADQIKAEVLKLLLEQGSAEKDLYSPQATVLRTEEEAQKTAVRAFSIDTSTKDNVVVTPDNFNQYFWTVDDAYYDPATGITTLTQNWPSQKGSMSLDTKMNVNKDFHFSGWVNLGDKYEGHPKEGVSGGDGIAFIFNPGNTHDLGLYGSALGVGGLKYAFGFKLDTFVNTQYDPKGKAKPDPIQFNKVGAFGAFVFADSTGTVSTQPGLTGWKAALLDVQPDNNQFQEFTIDYSGDTKVMTITYAGQTWTQSMTKYFSYTHKNEYALSIAATTGGAYNLQQVKIKEFTYTAAALLEEDFVDTDTQELFDRPLRTSGDVDSIITVQDHSAYLAEKGYKLISEDTSFAHTYDKTKKTVKLTNASQFIVYQVKDIEPPKIGDITEQTVNVNSEMTPLVLDITDNSKYIKTKTVTGLPAGVTFDEATNTISGTPTDVGTSTITVTATDHAGLTTTKTFTYTVVDTQPPTITQVENKTTEAYTPITPIALSADDNSKVAPTLEVTGLPAGLSFDPSTKQITGTPTAEGTFTVTVKATDGSTNASNSTFNIVVNPNAALEALKTAVADAKTVNKNDFTPNSVAVLDAKLTEAEALIAHPENGSTDQFNAKTQEVKQAKDQLVRKANKTDLEKAIAEASKYTNLDPAKPMDQQLITALANAKNTDADQNATKEQVDTATADLNKAIEQKLYQDALDRLNAAITDAKGVNQSEYTPASVTPFDAAIKAGETKAADKTATPEQLDLATKSITDAKAQLQHNADKSALEAAINKAKALGVLNETDTEDKAVKDALTLGESVKDNANATTQQVADATKAINDAIAAKAHADALDALKAKLVEVKALDKAPFTPDSVNALNAQVTAGDTVVAAEKSKTTEEIKEATQALTDAQKALVKQADKTELQKAIDKAGTLGQLNPSDTEDKAVQDALAKANQVKADGNATPQQVTEATDALNKAIDKKLYQDALDELNAAIKDAEAVTKANYTPETVTPFETALTDGKAKAADTQATPEQLKAAAQAIKTAKDALKQKANKAELEKSIATAEALQPLKAGDPEDDAVKAALEKAKQVEANQNADQAAVDAAKVELDNAIKAKQTQDAADALKQAALDELKAELAKVAKIDKNNFTPESVTPLTEKETAGNAIVANPENKTVDEIKAATQALKDAEKGLQAKSDKAALQAAIDKAEALTGLNPADAEDKAVQDALNKAKEVQADPNADQAAVDAAKKALDDAINAKQTQDAKEAKDAADAKQAALDELKAELAKVAQIDKNNFTPNTVTPLTEKEDAGKAIVAAPDAKTTDEIKAATQALKDAEAALQAKSDKAALQAAIDKANALGQLDPADKEDKALQDAVAAGETVKADGNATPQQVQEATKAINDAIAAKERQDALDELQKALDDAKTVNKDDYKPNTVAPFEAAITAGEAAKADATKTPEELKAAAKAITDAKNNLEAKANKDALNKAITTAEGLTLDPNDKEDKAVQDALAKAKEVQADPNADQAAVDAAKAALEDAINAKNAQDAKDAKEAADAKQAALDALKAELEKAKAVQKDNFTPDSVKPLTDAETAGQAIVDAPTDKTVEEINKATQALKDAQAGLVAKADKAELDKAITAAEGLTLDPNDKEDKAVQDALNKAKEVQANPNATQDEVNAAKDALNKAIEAKTAQDQADAVNAALDALKAELEKAKAVQKDNFTPDSVKPLTDAETAGQAIVDAPTGKTVEEINKATQALKDAQAGLVAKADKTELEKSIATAEGLGQLDPADKEDKAVQDALAAAKAVEQNPNATQTEVDNAKAALDEAINAKKAQDAKEAKEAADAKQAALDELKAELAKVAKIDLKQYTPDSVKPLTDKEIEGNAIVAIPDAKTTEEIKVVTQALKDAQKDLVQKADKAELQKAIDKANALGNLDANDPEDKAVQDKLADAEKVKADDNATPQQVAEATKALNDAIAAKERQDALDELQKAIDAANAINKDDYKPNTVKPLEDAVKAGETAKADAAKTPAELKEAAKAITDAQKALEAKANKDELNKVITTAEGLTLDPNDKEDKAVQDALAKAKEVQADPNASQADVDAAKAALENAVNAKKAQDEKEAQAAAQAKQDALDALKAELEKVAKINKNNFTPNTVTPLTEKEEAGKAIVANPDAKTTEEIKAATQALIDAENALQAKSDKAALQAAIDKANGLGELNPADKEDKAVQDAVAAGEKVKADGNATPQQVADATKAINDAFTAKERQDALDELQKAIDAANAINKDDYKPNTVKPLEDAVKAGETAKADAAKTPAELKEAAQAIKDAQKALEAKANKDELNKVITTAEGLTLDPTDKEDKAVQDALAKAKEVQADANASQADVDAAKAALEEAINAKQAQDAKEAKEAADAKQAALDALKAELEKAKAINKDNFTPNSVKPLTDAETTGQAIVDAPDNKTTKEIEAATQALKDAQAGLVAKADKAELEKAINTAEGLTLDPNDKEDKAVQDALNKAKEVEANPNATQDEVNAAKDALNKAVEAKVAQDQADAVNAALDALKAELEKAKTVNKDNFTPDSVKPLTDAETAGQAIVNDSTGKTVEEIEEATQALKDAQAGLVAKADKAELEKAINTAEGLTLDPSDKEDKAVQDALAKAKEVEANPNATQDEVNAAKDALNKAIEAKAAQDKADAVNAALDALKAELEKAKAINKDNFTPNSVKPLTDAETAGQSIVNDPTGKTVEQINAATQALKDAQADLVAKADKSELQKAIDKANALGNLDANDKEDKAVQDAVASGEKVKADGNATSLQVADATKAINDAIVAKEHQDALDELQKALDAANTVKKEQYKPSTVAPFEAAVTAGEAAKVDATKTPQELRKAAKAITDAQKALEAKANKVELEKSIATAENLGQLDPTDKEDKAVQDALSKAKEVEANLNATQAEVDAAKDALNKAIEGKTAQDKADAVNAALDALKAELEKAKAINKDNFTPNSVEALVDAMAVAQGIVNNPESVTVEQIEKATQALKYAQAGLVAKADKAELEKAIENAEGLTLDPADKEDKAVQDALDKAKEVQADPNASQADVDAAKDALNKAIEAKTAQDKADAVNTALDALKAELEKAKAVNKDNFTPNSVEALVDAMAVAQGIVNNPESVTVEQIEKATQALKDAQAGLVAKADKAELEKAINTAEDLTLDPSDKEDKAVQDALAKAKEVEANPNATQDEVNAAKDALNKAIEAKATQDKADAVNAALDALKAELEKAKAINKDNFTPNSVEPLADAMAVAQGIVNNPESVTIEQIEKATQALKDAQAGLVAKANKVELEKSIATAENLGQLDPTDKEDKAVHDALSKAKEVEANPNATQDEVNAAKDALNKAIEVKAAQDKADALAELQKTLDKAQSIDRTKYTPETVKDLDKSVDKGKVVVENSKEVSIKTIEDATKAIKDSLKDLVVKVDASETEKVAHTAKTTTGKSVERASDKAVKKSEGSTAQAKANKTSKAKVLPNTGQEAPADPKYATLMLAIGGLMAMFGRRKKEDKDNTEK
ncbi:lectin-like domain-containing protein [Staphylococcus simulans]|uniref:lectin-like domain-containing protein n=1 Tax=Staphylococcus simulans TaxID=1286 RepID=UPI0039999DB5